MQIRSPGRYRQHEAGLTCSAAPMQKQTAPIIMVYFRPSFWKNFGNTATTRAAQPQTFVSLHSASPRYEGSSAVGHEDSWQHSNKHACATSDWVRHRVFTCDCASNEHGGCPGLQASIVKSAVSTFLLLFGTLLCLSHFWEEETQKLQAQCAHHYVEILLQ